MSNIYELPKEIEEALNKYYECFDEDWCLIVSPEEFEEINKWLQELQNKKEELINWFLSDRVNKQAENAGLDMEIKRLQDRIKRNNNKIKFIESFIDFNFKDDYKKPIQHWNFTISYRKSKATIIENKELIPKEYIKERVSYSEDKTAIKKALEAWEEVKGAKLEERLNLNIK